MDVNNLVSLKINDRIFDSIVAEIASLSDKGIPQPMLIVGEEGTGKTTLLKRISYNVSDKTKVFIDGRMLFKADEIIKTWENSNSPSLLIIDNWDFYLSRSDFDDQYRLRKFLYNEGAPMMIASVRKQTEALTDYNAPFFEGLDILYIEPISDEWLHNAFTQEQWERAKKLWHFLPKTIKSIITIREILKLNEDPNLDLSMCISRFADRYRNIYQNLPIYSQIILNALDDDLILSEIREKTSLPTSILPSYLSQLKKLGIIKTDKSTKRKTKYSIKDPMFNLWLRHSY